MQRNDDDGRQIRQPWLGAKGARWPMDWTYDEWALGLAGFLIGGTLITWVVPSAVLAFIVIRSVARFISVRNNPDAPRKTYLLVVAMMTTLCLIFSINPMFWLKPIYFPLAIVASLFMPSRAVKLWGKHIGWNRPIAYWLALPFRVARGPRLVPADQINPAALGMGLDLERLDRNDIGDLTPGRIITIPRPRKPAYKVKSPASKPAPRTAKPVKAKITSTPKRHQSLVRKRPGIPGMKPAKKIYRTSTGLVVFGTEFRMENR